MDELGVVVAEKTGGNGGPYSLLPIAMSGEALSIAFALSAGLSLFGASILFGRT
jgi:hypothetical protein